MNNAQHAVMPGGVTRVLPGWLDRAPPHTSFASDKVTHFFDFIYFFLLVRYDATSLRVTEDYRIHERTCASGAPVSLRTSRGRASRQLPLLL